ncbi:MAG: hypothetical protein ACK56F_23370, partial [bacterium]
SKRTMGAITVFCPGTKRIIERRDFTVLWQSMPSGWTSIPKEFWKFELSDQELVQFRKLTVKKLQNYYSKFEMFNALFESLDNEINSRVIVKEDSLV